MFTNLKTVFIVCILLLASFSLAQNNATTSNAITQRLEQEIAAYEANLQATQQELNEIDAVLGNSNRRLQQNIRERNDISESISSLREERRLTQVEMVNIENDIEASRIKYRELNQDLGTMNERLSLLLVSLHKQRVGPYARILLESQSLFRFRLNNRFLSMLSAQDVLLLQNIDQALDGVERLQQELNEQVRAKEAVLARLNQNELDLQAAEAQLEQQIQTLEATREGQLAQRRAFIEEQQLIENFLSTSRQNLDTEVTRLTREAEEARRAAEEAQRAALQAQEEERARIAREAEERARAAEERRQAFIEALPETAEQFSAPFTNPLLVSAYGEVGNLVEIRAQQINHSVSSVLAGKVTDARLLTANSGFVVTIQHTQNMLTVYQNLQAPIVNVGDTVEQGTVLGYLGGGSLIPQDILQFRVGIYQDSDRLVWVDPSERLGLQ